MEKVEARSNSKWQVKSDSKDKRDKIGDKWQVASKEKLQITMNKLEVSQGYVWTI